jgi:uncharacterized YccA/Bax inhibitor family protein
LATSNPVFTSGAFAQFERAHSVDRSHVMTVQGTAGKTFLLLAILSATAIWSWIATANEQADMVLLPAAGIGGFILALITIFKPTVAPWTAPIYAAFEGVFLGMFSYLIETKIGKGYPGIALQAVALTSGTLLAMLFVYSTGMVKVTDRLKRGVIAATGAICLL